VVGILWGPLRESKKLKNRPAESPSRVGPAHPGDFDGGGFPRPSADFLRGIDAFEASVSQQIHWNGVRDVFSAKIRVF
jgi:hypothetical protein